MIKVENIKIGLGESTLNVFDVRLFKGTFILTLLFGTLGTSKLADETVKSNLTRDISIFWEGACIFVSSEDVRTVVKEYSFVLIFNIWDIR